MCEAPERSGRQHDVHHIRPFADFGPESGGPEAYVAANALDNLITLCPSCHRMAEKALGMHGALSGIGHALQHVSALHLMCDARDIAVSTAAVAPWTGRPTVAVFERASAGVGFGAALYALHEPVVQAAAELITSCPCESGCPSCVGPAGDGERSAKAHAVAVLRVLGA
jgi:DEAD/DEAH box helicase domain-containing protein